MGKGYALKNLFGQISEAFDDTFIVTIDADAQHNPSDIPKMIESLKNDGADYAIGVRTNQKWWRASPNKLLDKLLGKHHETQSGFRVYTMRAIRKINITTNGFGVDSEIVKCLNGMKVSYVPINVKYDKNSHTKNPITHFLEIVSYILTNNPIAYLCIPAVIMFGGSIWGYIDVITLWQTYHQLALGTMIGSMTLMVLSVITFFTGVILHVLRKPERKP